MRAPEKACSPNRGLWDNSNDEKDLGGVGLPDKKNTLEKNSEERQRKRDLLGGGGLGHTTTSKTPRMDGRNKNKTRRSPLATDRALNQRPLCHWGREEGKLHSEGNRGGTGGGLHEKTAIDRQLQPRSCTSMGGELMRHHACVKENKCRPRKYIPGTRSQNLRGLK